GTGLYIDAVVKNLDIPRVPPNPELRKKLEKELKKKGVGFLYKKLIKFDPEAAYIIDPQNGRRIIRALEVMLATKKPFTAQRRRGKPLFKTLQIGILTNKEKLNRRIDRRVDQMIKDGLVPEVKNLIKKYPKNLPSFDAIGYREIIQYLAKIISLPETINQIKKNTRRFARRQMSWFRRDKSIRWVKNLKEAKKLIKDFLKPKQILT
ncbi:MAG: tRNA (adenosine(37)-N6)-dimethylallyltransferase MiaA, partial [bacterium]|nr:tRNA (adenosine(37)-N6)-dimethylallyltransferase MiaA [bacterium]